MVAGLLLVGCIILLSAPAAVGQVVSLAVPGAGPVTFAYVTDPEGNIIELQCWSV